MRIERRCTRSGFPPSGTIGPAWEDTPAEQPRCEKWWEADGECVWEEVYVIPVDEAVRTAFVSSPGDGHIAPGYLIPGPLDGSIMRVLVVEADEDEGRNE